AVQPRQAATGLEQRLHLIGVKLERAPERLERLLVPLVIEQRPPQQQQRRQVVRVLLQHFGEPHHGGPGAPAAAQQVRERQGRLVEGGQGLERVLVRLLRLTPRLDRKSVV